MKRKICFRCEFKKMRSPENSVFTSLESTL